MPKGKGAFHIMDAGWGNLAGPSWEPNVAESHSRLCIRGITEQLKSKGTRVNQLSLRKWHFLQIQQIFKGKQYRSQ